MITSLSNNDDTQYSPSKSTLMATTSIHASVWNNAKTPMRIAAMMATVLTVQHPPVAFRKRATKSTTIEKDTSTTAMNCIAVKASSDTACDEDGRKGQTASDLFVVSEHSARAECSRPP